MSSNCIRDLPKSAIQRLQDKHKKEIQKLQNACKHRKTEILPYAWGLGYFSESYESCKRCGKIIKYLPMDTPNGTATTNWDFILLSNTVCDLGYALLNKSKL